jgi:alkanesulfonate monooxygenase SsuD/methylene tetrahydromethanopterin reductase-like flavin-dependent oxidoreductase (luciferase family)
MADASRLHIALGLNTGLSEVGNLPGLYGDLAEQFDTAVDILTLEDGFARPEGDGPDALLLANWLGARTRHVGILPGAPVNFLEPFHVSTAVATLDYVTEGRAGLLVQPLRGERIGQAQRAIGALNGFPEAEGGALAADTREAVEVIRALWDSWQDDAIIRDTASQRFVDGSRLHYIRYRGERFEVLGPSITPRPPQGQPVVAIGLQASEHAALAAGADVVFLSVEEAALDTRLAALHAGGHKPLIFADVLVSFGGADAGRTALCWDGAPEGLAALSRRPSLAGLRFIPADPARDLAPLLAALPAARQAPGTLRQRLGLPPAPNRHLSAAAAA